MGRKIYIFSLALLILISGCAREKNYRSRSSLEKYNGGFSSFSNSTAGFYHQVTKGETLWRIARQYQLSVGELSRTNKLSNINAIESGQLIFIPKKPSSGRTSSQAKSERIYSEKNFVWPVRGEVISRFGEIKNEVPNKGIDLKAELGREIVATKSGRVSFVGEQVKGYGKMILIDHANNWQSVYAHNSENLVKVNELVKQNQVIAKVGSSGRANFPYLHFEIRKNHKPLNPLPYLKR